MLFQFNQYSSLLLPFFIQGVIFTFLLLVRAYRQGRGSDLYLGLILGLYTLRVSQWMLGFAGWYDVRDWHSTVMFYIPFQHWLAIGPLVYFYFRSLTNTQFNLERRHLWHFVPALLWIGRFIFIFVADIVVEHWINGNPMPEFSGTQGYFAANGTGEPFWIWVVLEYVSVFTYLILTLRLFRGYRQYIKNQFSDLEHIDFSWIRNFLIANLAGFIVWLLFELLDFVGEKPLSFV